MKATLKDGILTIELPANAVLAPSKSGKSKLVATTNGNKPTALIVDGKPVVISVNAYVAA